MQTSTPPQPLSPQPGRWLRGSRRRSHDAPPQGLDMGRLLLGLAVVAVGVLFLLEAAGVLDAGTTIAEWWPLLVIAAGVLNVAERPPEVVRGALFVVAGSVLLLFTTDVLDESAWAYVWPALVIVAGLAIVMHWHGRTIPSAAVGEDVIRSTAIFGGPKIVSSAQCFQGAWLTAIFGGITLDLRNARLAPDGASINATGAFGGIEVLVPKGWRVSVRSTPIFGGVDDNTDHSAVIADDAPTLYIDAVTIFGGIDIKHDT